MEDSALVGQTVSKTVALLTGRRGSNPLSSAKLKGKNLQIKLDIFLKICYNCFTNGVYNETKI